MLFRYTLLKLRYLLQPHQKHKKLKINFNELSIIKYLYKLYILQLKFTHNILWRKKKSKKKKNSKKKLVIKQLFVCLFDCLFFT